MKKLVFIFILICIQTYAQPGKALFTPIDSLIPLEETTVNVPNRFRKLTDTTRVLRVPLGTFVDVLWVGNLIKPRMLRIGRIPTSTYSQLFVSDMVDNGAIYRIPLGHETDSLIPVVKGVKANDFQIFDQIIYIAEETRILRCNDSDGDGYYETKTVIIPNLMEGADFPSGGHSTRSIEFTNNKLYVSIGSSCNACRESNRAVILEYNEDGSGRRIFASGVRNAVGLTQVDNKLYANNNGSDWLGNDLPGEWIDEIRDGGFYGYPFAFGNQVWVDMESHSDYQKLKPITEADSAKVASMQQPLALIQAHSAPMALRYMNPLEVMKSGGNGLDYLPGFLCVLRGSWNRSPATGYKIVFLHRPNPDSLISSVSDWASGFLLDSITGAHWGRPVGLVYAKWGDASNNFYLSLDGPQGMILHFIQPYNVGLESKQKELFTPIYPNPFNSFFELDWNHPEQGYLRILSTEGKTLFEQSLEPGKNTIHTENLTEGVYLVEIKTNTHSFYQRIIKQP